MDAHDHDELPDGAWFAILETAAESFMEANKIRGDKNDAVHQWLSERTPQEGA
jgi:hypothetical protein